MELFQAEYSAEQLAEKLIEYKRELASLTERQAVLAERKEQECKIIAKLQELGQTVDKLEQELSGKLDILSKVSAELQSSRYIIQELAGDIPTEIMSKEVLKDRQRQTHLQQEKLKAAFEQAEAGFRNSEAACSLAANTRENSEKLLAEAQKELLGAKQQFIQALKTARFTGEEEYYQVKLAEETMITLEDEVNNYYAELKSATDAHNKAAAVIKDLTFADIVGLEQQFENLKIEKEKILQQFMLVSAKLKHNSSMLAELLGLNAAISNEEEGYRYVADLANIAKGNNRKKLSFERYVLVEFFNEIITAANIRLRKMTSGRYRMNRIIERGKGAAQSGLEIEVFDYYTGRTRHVKTLSGGESFKASLSLALGLADIIQSASGGINLDTMFIDEGFGTLDPESLDNAVNCLVDLQHAGRLVGIISHVPELKASIDAQLEVTADKAGSKAVFYVS